MLGNDTERKADRDTCIIMARSPLLDDVFASCSSTQNVRKDREQNTASGRGDGSSFVPLLQASFTYLKIHAASLKNTTEEVLALLNN